MVPVAAMDEHPAGRPAVIDNKATTAPHGSPTPAPVVDKQQEKHHHLQHPQQQPSPKMQSAPPLPPVSQHQQQHHQQHQHPQYYGAPNAQQLSSSSDYRGSPPGGVPMSLPSIQHFEGANMQSQPQYLPPSHMNGAPSMMHAQAYNSNMVQYQPQPMAPTMPSNAPNGHNGMMRYPIPPQAPMDVRQMSGGRHKKEIKRRTKSGCLTCRKRRIKCDEAHPECRNCQKSKRTCMGYDPVYKNDRVPSIQPAPVSSAPPSKPSPILSTVPSNAYPPYQGAGGNYIQQMPPAAAHMDGSMPYHTSVDSVIAEQDAKLPSAATNNGYVPSVQMARRFVKLTIDELFDLNEIPPQLPVRTVPDLLSPEVNKEFEDFYKFKYAHALDKLFETSWYTTLGFATLTADHQLHEFAVQCMEEMRAKPAAYVQAVPSPALASLEARLVWSLAAMPRVHHLHNTNSASPSTLTLELLPRLDTVEHLLTGRYLDVARVPSPPASVVEMSGEQDPKSVQQAFWYHLGRFTSLRDDQGDAQTLDDVSRELANMRVILEVLENRDVLYSIAVARHIGGRIPDWSPQTPHLPLSNDPTDDVNKLSVAYGFVQTEDQRGTSQVIQRICSMSLRSWSLQQRQQ